MDMLSHKRLAGNAYRVLGLPAGSSQAQIEAAARRMRIWADPAQIPPTPWDMPALGPVGRRRIDIEEAVARLNEPRSRVMERLAFITIDPEWFSSPSVNSSHRTTTDHPCADHDAAILDLLAATQVPADKFIMGNAYGEALRRLAQAISSDGYRAWFASVEHEGAFEKRAEPFEINRPLDGFVESVIVALSTQVRDALDRNEFVKFDRLMALRNSITPDRDLLARHTQEISDRMEDLLTSQCVRLQNEIFHGINWDKKGWLTRVKASEKCCLNVADQIARTVSPLLKRFAPLVNADPDRMARVVDPAARMYRNLALGWQRARKYTLAKRAFGVALDLTQNAALRAKLKADLADMRKRVGVFPVNAVSGARSWKLVCALIALSTLGKIAFLQNEPSRNATPPPTMSPQDLRNLNRIIPPPQTPPHFSPAPFNPGPMFPGHR